ncbi:MAG: hypothetical protein HKN94_06070 [Acidimicrobiales bacterium]|nr:hypothetical protein [Acidimicrobiales bacterium]RZV46312.1 MAG: hypothetical protein EX269_07655 [Acidimicrobiales bacterium]
MTNTPGESDMLNDVWAVDEDPLAQSEDCGPTKVCRNAREFTFDGIADEGQDLATSWRQLLEREGKIADSGSPVRDLVLGSSDD